jgi:hypothetical protein
MSSRLLSRLRFRGNPPGKSITPKGYFRPIGVIDRGKMAGSGVREAGIRPAASASRREEWWAVKDSNLRPTD